jgi:hypothetical protein
MERPEKAEETVILRLPGPLAARVRDIIRTQEKNTQIPNVGLTPVGTDSQRCTLVHYQHGRCALRGDLCHFDWPYVFYT